MADTPASRREYGYYQRLLARDQSEAADLIERYIKTESPALGVRRPAAAGAQLCGARPLEQRLSPDEENAVIDATRELLVGRRGVHQGPQPWAAALPEWSTTSGRPREPLRVRLRDQRRLPTSSRSTDARASGWTICQFQSRLPGTVACRPRSCWRSVQSAGVAVVCLADAASPVRRSKARYLGQETAACACPKSESWWGGGDRRRWQDDSTQVLRDAGATLVASTLLETATYLAGLVEIPRIPDSGDTRRHAA
jgi:hypothetical protein